MNNSNCITKIPQDIKCKLNPENNTITIKAGSKIYFPAGFEEDDTTLKFNTIILENDINCNYIYAVQALCCLRSDTLEAFSLYTQQCYSGDTLPSISSSAGPGVFWYDTVNNLIKYSADKGQTWLDYTLSLPIFLATGNNQELGQNWKSLDQVFNGFGYIGSELFVLPNVEIAATQGKTIEGLLHSIRLVTENILIYDISATTQTNKEIILYNNSNGKCDIICAPQTYTIPTLGYVYYDEINNYIHISEPPFNAAIVGSVFINSDRRINKLRTKNIINFTDSSQITQQTSISKISIDLELGPSNTTYIIPANGWLFLDKQANTNQYIQLIEKDNYYNQTVYSSQTNSRLTILLPVKKEMQIVAVYTATGNTNAFRFIYAEGAI